MINNAMLNSVVLESGRTARTEALTGSLKNRSEGASFGEQLKNELARRDERTDIQLKDACVQMESIFVGKMLKEMRKSVQKSEWISGGFAEEVFEDMLYDEYALSISKNSNMGIAKMMYEEMSRKL